MKSLRTIAAAGMVCLLIASAFLLTPVHHQAHAAVPVTGATFGNTQLVLAITSTNTSSGYLNLANSSSTTANKGVPCSDMALTVVLSGTNTLTLGSGTATCTMPLYATATTGGTLSVSGTNTVSFTAGSGTNTPLKIPCTRTDQLWFNLSGGSAGGTATINAMYLK